MKNTLPDEKTNHPGITKRWRQSNGKNKSVYRAQVRLKGFPNKSKTFNKLSDAIEWKAKTETDLRSGLISSSKNADMTFKEAVADFEDYLKVEHMHHQSKTLQNWNKERSNIRFLYHLGVGDMKVRDIDFHYMSDLMLEINCCYGYLKTNSINNKINAMSRVLNYLIDKRKDVFPNLINPVPSFRNKAYNARERILTLEEEKVISRENFFVILMETAMRRSELTKLTWEDVKFHEKKIRILGSNTKNDTTRYTYMSDAVIMILRDMHEKQNISAVHPMMLDEHKLFNEHPDTWTKRFSRLCKEHGFNNLVLHDLRHHAITKLVKMKSFSIYQISEITGHKDLKMLHRYANSDTNELAVTFNREKGKDALYHEVYERLYNEGEALSGEH